MTTRPTWFSAKTAEVALAIPIFYLLAEQAVPLFPTSRTSSPSERVLIVKKGTIRVQDLNSLPVQVSWEQWEKAVLPVLEDEDLKVRSPMFRQALAGGRLDEWIHLVGKKVKLSFEAAGYGDPS